MKELLSTRMSLWLTLDDHENLGVLRHVCSSVRASEYDGLISRWPSLVEGVV
jgi:hypothetical protein